MLKVSTLDTSRRRRQTSPCQDPKGHPEGAKARRAVWGALDTQGSTAGFELEGSRARTQDVEGLGPSKALEGPRARRERSIVREVDGVERASGLDAPRARELEPENSGGSRVRAQDLKVARALEDFAGSS